MVPPIPIIDQDGIAMEYVIPVSSDDSATSTTNHIEILEEESVHLKKRQLKETADVNKKLISDSVLATKSEITDLYAIENSKAGANKVEKNTLNSIIDGTDAQEYLVKKIWHCFNSLRMQL